jgi:hypothetical protein
VENLAQLAGGAADEAFVLQGLADHRHAELDPAAEGGGGVGGYGMWLWLKMRGGAHRRSTRGMSTEERRGEGGGVRRACADATCGGECAGGGNGRRGDAAAVLTEAIQGSGGGGPWDIV